MKEITVYAIGLCSASICASNNATIEEITEKINQDHPTGLDHGWEFAKGESFRQGNSNPCPCNINPDTHKHYLFHC